MRIASFLIPEAHGVIFDIASLIRNRLEQDYLDSEQTQKINIEKPDGEPFVRAFPEGDPEETEFVLRAISIPLETEERCGLFLEYADWTGFLSVEFLSTYSFDDIITF